MLTEELGEAAKEAYELHNAHETVNEMDPESPDEYSQKFWRLFDEKLACLKDELVQVAAVAVRFLENLD